MSNRLEQIQNISKNAHLPNFRANGLSKIISDHINDVSGYSGIRNWLKNSESSVTITEKTPLNGSTITSKKGDIAESAFDVDISENNFIPYGIKPSITNKQINAIGNPDASVNVLERFISSIAIAMRTAEAVAACAYVYKQIINPVISKIGYSPFDAAILNQLFEQLETNGWITEGLIMNPNHFSCVRTFGKNFFDEATLREITMTGLFGHLWTADVRVVPSTDLNFVLAFGRKGETLTIDKSATKSNSKYTSVDRKALEYILPIEPLAVGYSFIGHSDNTRSRHIFDIKSSIGVRINDLSGISAVKIVK